MTTMKVIFGVPATIALLTSLVLGIWGDAVPDGSVIQGELFAYATSLALFAVAIAVTGTVIIRARLRSARRGR